MSVQLERIDDLDGLITRARKERERRQQRRQQQERRRREEERAEEMLDNYFQQRSLPELRTLAEGGEPAVGPPFDLPQREQVERAEDALRERGENTADLGEWVRDLDREALKTLACGHRSLDGVRNSSCGCQPRRWGELFQAAPSVGKSAIAAAAQRELDRRQRERAMADGTGVSTRQVAFATDRSTAWIALAVAAVWVVFGRR